MDATGEKTAQSEPSHRLLAHSIDSEHGELSGFAGWHTALSQ
jgi:hypothetical protein